MVKLSSILKNGGIMRTSILQVKAIFGLYGGNIRLSLDADGKNGTLFIKKTLQ